MASKRMSLVFRSLFVAQALVVFFVAGCGNSGNNPIIFHSATPTPGPTASSAPTSARTPTPTPTATFAPPFDTGKGEGDLVSDSLVATYPTSGAPAGLNTYYVDTICPDALSSA